MELSSAFETQDSELEAERGRLEALSTELVTVEARAEAQAGLQADQAERLKRMEAELAAARDAAAAAREEAAKLTGQAEALSAQHADCMRVIGGPGRGAAGGEGKKVTSCVASSQG